MNNIHTLVIPDVHGRIFWKNAVQKINKEDYPDVQIIFLGDYLDPYMTIEDVTRLSAIENFKEIIEYTRTDSRVHLLIGNHDMHYFYNAPYKSRVDHENYNIIKKIFEENLDLFNVAYEEIINGVKYFYTHAGVNSYWLTKIHNCGKFGIEYHKIGNVSDEQLPFCEMISTMGLEADKFNKFLHNFQGHALLWTVSYERGGDDNCGSCIWMDLNEWAYENYIIEGAWQVFGHTLRYPSLDEPYINEEKQIAMLDSRNAWIIDDQGKFIHIKNVK